MNAGQLKELLKDIPDNARILIPSSDHSYLEVDVEYATALYDSKTRQWTEDHGEDTTPEADYGKRLWSLIAG